jgi:hypothetical protein
MKLLEIQKKLDVPKNQLNKFGGYKYRSCEDILEALKPLLDEPVILADEIVQIGDRYYVKATAKYGEVEVTAYAREEETKKGMDASQITGSASSYARKYALNGLFAIDDTKDADTQDNTKVVQSTTQAPKTPAKTAGGVCKDCGAPMKTSKTGKPYCSALCWKKANPKQTQDDMNNYM